MPTPTKIVVHMKAAVVSRRVRGRWCAGISVIFCWAISAGVLAMKKSVDPLNFYGYLNIQGRE
jgi:hypothetical protein